jgi:hypothetical protein
MIYITPYIARCNTPARRFTCEIAAVLGAGLGPAECAVMR